MTADNAHDIVVIAGSLRKQAFSRKIARALIELAPAELKLELVEIGLLPLYNQDLEVDPAPAEWTAFRQRVVRAKGVIFVTPEYNRSMPAALKNAIDVGSRPWGKSVWAGKPAALVSTSPGAIGGYSAYHNLRTSLACLDVPILPAPELYMSGVDKLLDDAGKVSNPATRELLGKLLTNYVDWVQRTNRTTA
jgi:chromate reductase